MEYFTGAGKESASDGMLDSVTGGKAMKGDEILPESEAEYRAIVENSLVGVYIAQDGVFRFVNKRFCEIYGYLREEIVDTLGSLDLAHPDDKRAIEENTKKLLAGEFKDFNVVRKGVRKDGEVIVVNALGSVTHYKGRRAISGIIYDITEQEKAQEELRQKTALLEAQIKASLDGIVIVDNGKKILQNQQIVDLLKIPRHIAENDDNEAQIEWVKGLAKRPELFYERAVSVMAHPDKTFRDELELKDGRFFDTYSSPVIGKNGERYGSIVTFRDITDLKRSEEALRASQFHLSEAMNLAHIVYWESDTETKELIFNDAFYAFYGTTAEQEGGYRMTAQEYAHRFVYPEDMLLFLQILDRSDAETPPESYFDFEHRIVRRDGKICHVFARVRIIRDNWGRVVRVFGADQDITERKQMEDVVQESEERFRMIFEEGPVGMIMVGADFRFIRANAAFCGMLGYTEEELGLCTVKEITHLDDITGDELRLKDLMEGRIPLYRTEKRFIRKDNEVMWGSATVNIMRGRNNCFLYLFATIEDITQRKRSEEEKRHLESQLFQAQKMEAIGTLAGGIAHDFNNILTALIGYAALLKMKMDNSTLGAYVDQILSASEKATELVQNLLAFSRQQTISLKPVSIQSIIRETEKLLQRLVTEDISIKTQLAAEDITIMADATQIHQILFNLAANARDAMPRGGTLTIETKVVVLDEEFQRIHGYGKPGRYVLLSVSDTGVGMDEATQKRIFDPFFSTKEVGKGTGLGLSTVYGIVKQHGGYISVYSEQKLGTIFHIHLPVVDNVGQKPEPESALLPAEEGGEIILIAEDNEGVRNLMREVLIGYGYTTIEAADGVDAIEQFEKAGSVDLLILDSVMPKMNGREVYNEICKIKPGVKVLFTSGYTRDVVLDKGIEDKRFAFLQKPVSPNSLLQKVRKVLDKGQEIV